MCNADEHLGLSYLKDGCPGVCSALHRALAGCRWQLGQLMANSIDSVLKVLPRKTLQDA